MVWIAARRGQPQSPLLPLPVFRFLRAPDQGKKGKPIPWEGSGMRKQSGTWSHLPTWVYHRCLPGPKSCARSPTDKRSITAVQAGNCSWSLAFFQRWSVSTRICVRSTGVWGWSCQRFYYRLKEEDLFGAGGGSGGDNEWKKGCSSRRPSPAQPKVCIPWFKLLLPVQAVLRQYLNANFLFFKQNTASLHFRRWSGLQKCQYIQLIHCDIGIQPKGSPVCTEGSK